VSYFSIIFWLVTVAVIFGVLWWQGQITRLAGYIRETRVELEKCSWPTWEELKGSTVLVSISIAILGLFTVGVDRVLYYIFIVLKF
jgi:preprotein translocase subunit SecE